MKLRLPTEKLAGIYHLPRFIDKARLKLAGELPEDYQGSFCNPAALDGLLLKFLGFKEDEILAAIDGASDQEIADWVASRVTPEQTAAWNELSYNLGGPGTPGRERFEKVLPIKYPNLPHDFPGTVFEAIAADEA